LSGFELTAKLVEALIWPVTLIVFLILFKGKVEGVLEALRERFLSLQEMTGPAGVSMRFADAVTKASEELPAVTSGPEEPAAPGGDALPSGPDGAPPTVAPSDALARQIQDLAFVSPRSAVLESFILLEGAVARAARRKRPDLDPRPGFMPSFRVIEPDLARDSRHALRRLNAARNEAAHIADFSLPPDLAFDYVVTAQRAVELLNDLYVDDLPQSPSHA